MVNGYQKKIDGRYGIKYRIVDISRYKSAIYSICNQRMRYLVRYIT
jgi:hypothetical protein